MKLRWFLARLLNRFGDTCWVDLVLWAINPGHHPFSEILEMRNTAGLCESRGETPYCGKCIMGVKAE